MNSVITTISIFHKDFPASCLVDPESDHCWYGECKHQNCGFVHTYNIPADKDELRESSIEWFKREEMFGPFCSVKVRVYRDSTVNLHKVSSHKESIIALKKRPVKICFS